MSSLWQHGSSFIQRVLNSAPPSSRLVPHGPAGHCWWSDRDSRQRTRSQETRDDMNVGKFIGFLYVARRRPHSPFTFSVLSVSFFFYTLCTLWWFIMCCVNKWFLNRWGYECCRLGKMERKEGKQTMCVVADGETKKECWHWGVCVWGGGRGGGAG
jgi:hypothetical protein